MEQTINETNKKVIFLDLIDGFEFEKLCCSIFSSLYNGSVKNTPCVGDAGKDIIISDEEEIIFVECKHHLNHTIGRPVIQKLHSAVVTEGANKGIVITTGSFSKNAIEYASKVTPRIELKDKNIFIDMAQRAGFEIHTSFGKEKILNFPVRSDNRMHEALASFLDEKVISNPIVISDILRIINRRISFRPFYMLDYRVQADFITSVGLVHSENGRGKIIIDGSIGRACDENLSKYIIESGRKSLTERLEGSFEKEHFKVLSNQINNVATSEIIKKHTKYVSYRGNNNVNYTKECKPKSKDISIFNLTQFYMPLNKLNIGLFNRQYSLNSFDTCKSDLFVYNHNITQCQICSSELTKKGILCNECGSIVHDKKFWKSHGFYCKRCGKSLCRSCASYYSKLLFFTVVLCHDCIENGPEIKKKIKKFKPIKN